MSYCNDISGYYTEISCTDNQCCDAVLGKHMSIFQLCKYLYFWQAVHCHVQLNRDTNDSYGMIVHGAGVALYVAIIIHVLLWYKLSVHTMIKQFSIRSFITCASCTNFLKTDVSHVFTGGPGQSDPRPLSRRSERN